MAELRVWQRLSVGCGQSRCNQSISTCSDLHSYSLPQIEKMPLPEVTLTTVEILYLKSIKSCPI